MQQNVEARELSKEHPRIAEDSIQWFEELKMKISKSLDLTAGMLINEECQILLGKVKYCGKPFVRYCLVANEKLEYEL